MRVLQDRSFYSMGDTNPCSVDVRVITATNKSIPTMIGKSDFREDLYYRFIVMEIALPALRERRDDIPLLTYYLLEKYAKRLNKPVKSIDTEALGALLRHDWPGNVRDTQGDRSLAAEIIGIDKSTLWRKIKR